MYEAERMRIEAERMETTHCEVCKDRVGVPCIKVKTCEKRPLHMNTYKQIIEECVQMIQGTVDRFREYLEFMDIDIRNLPEDEKFGFSLSSFELVQNVLLSHTSNAGGTSTMWMVNELELPDQWTFEFEDEEGDEDDEDC